MPTARITASAAISGRFSQAPDGVAVDTAGDLYVADEFNRVVKLAAGGVRSTNRRD